jgi:hypothetical protein
MDKTTLLAEALLKTQPKETVKEVIETLNFLEQQEKQEELWRAQQAVEAAVRLNTAWKDAWLF